MSKKGHWVLPANPTFALLKVYEVIKKQTYCTIVLETLNFRSKNYLTYTNKDGDWEPIIETNINVNKDILDSISESYDELKEGFNEHNDHFKAALIDFGAD